MAVVLNGSSDFLGAGSSLLTNETICISGWGYPNNITAQHTLLSLSEKSGAGFWSLEFSGATANDPIRAIKDNTAGTGAVSANSSAPGFSASTWSHASVNFTSDTSRDAFLNGANKGSNATSRTDSTPNQINIGVRGISTPINYFNGTISDVFVFDTIPSDAQHAILAKGIHPIDAGIPIANIRADYPLLADCRNRMGNGYPAFISTLTFAADSGKVIPPMIGALMAY